MIHIRQKYTYLDVKAVLPLFFFCSDPGAGDPTSQCWNTGTKLVRSFWSLTEKREISLSGSLWSRLHLKYQNQKTNRGGIWWTERGFTGLMKWECGWRKWECDKNGINKFWGQLPIHTSSRCRETLTFIWSCVYAHLMNLSPIFSLF